MNACFAALVLLGSGCGHSPSGTSRIQDDTAAVVKAMNAKDYPAARRALNTLDADLAAADRLDQLGASTVAELRSGVTKLKADLAVVSPIATTTPSPTARRTTAPPPTKGDGGRKHGKHD